MKKHFWKIIKPDLAFEQKIWKIVEFEHYPGKTDEKQNFCPVIS